MNQIKTSIILFFAILIGSGQLSAQTNFNGRYSFKSENGRDPSSFSLKFESKNAVYYSYFHNGAGTIGGKWSLENGIVNVVLARGEAKWSLKLKPNGNRLEIAETLSEMSLPDVPDFKGILKVGTTFTKEVIEPTGPALAPEEIGKRVLKLLKSMRTRKDISAKNIKRQTGVKVTFDPKDRNRYGFGGEVVGAADWFYGFYAYPYPSKDNKTTDTLRFSLDYQLNEPLNPETSIIGKAFNFNSMSKELQQAGFSAPQPNLMNHNRLSGWTFTRGKVSVRVSVTGGFEPNIDNTVTGVTVSF